MPDDPAAIPAILCHYAAYVRARVHVTPETSVNGNQAELHVRLGRKMLVVIFGCRKKKWPLRRIEIRRGQQTATFPRGDLARAIATLLAHEPLIPAPPPVSAASGPRTDATLRERRTTILRV